MTTNNNEWLDRTFSYWKPELLPTPREVMAILQANPTKKYDDVVDTLGIVGKDKQADAEWILETFVMESGDLNLQQKYKWLGSAWNVSQDGRTASSASLNH